MDSIEAKLATGKITSFECLREQNELLTYYSGRIFLSDEHLFNNETELYQFLITYAKLSEKTAKETVEHEKEHYEAAKKIPSSSPKYGCWLLRQNEDHNKVTCHPFVQLQGTRHELKEIILSSIAAVERKSSYDMIQEKMWEG